MIRCCILLLFCGSQSCAQVIPEPGESVEAYLDRWDAWIETIPEDQRAMPLIERVDARMDHAIADAGERRSWKSTPPDPDADEDEHADWDWTTKFIESNPDVMEWIHSYASMPAVGASLRDASFEHWFRPRPTHVLEITPEPYALADIAPQYRGSLREHALLLKADMYLAIERGDDQRLLADLRTLHDIARLNLVTGAWVDRIMVHAYTRMMASLHTNPGIDWSGIDTETMLPLIDILYETDQLLPADEALATERIVALELIDWLADDRVGDRFGPRGVVRSIDLKIGSSVPFLLGFGNPWEPESASQRVWLTLGALTLQRSLAPISQQIDRVNAYFDAANNLSNTDPARVRSLPRAFRWIDGAYKYEKLPFGMADIAIQARNLEYDLYLHRTFYRAAALRLCAEIHRRRNGEYPAGVEDLGEDLLRFDFTDPFSGHPLRLRVSDGSLAIYSVGPDRDDDQGSPLMSEFGMPVRYPAFIPLDDLEAMAESERESIDGDWVLYPPIE